MFKQNFLANKKILLIDDDGEHTSLIKRELSRLGFGIHIASSSKKAQKAPHYEYDLIMIDIQMENFFGLQFLKKLKRIELTNKIPVIIVSKLSEINFIETGLDLGAVDYLSKHNLDIRKLIAIINKHLIFFTARSNIRIS